MEDDQNIKAHVDVMFQGQNEIVDGNGNRIIRNGNNNIEQQVLEGDYPKNQGKKKQKKNKNGKDKKCIIF